MTTVLDPGAICHDFLDPCHVFLDPCHDFLEPDRQMNLADFVDLLKNEKSLKPKNHTIVFMESMPKNGELLVFGVTIP